MNWRPTIYWGTLAALVGLLALGLTRWITSVHLGSDRPFAIVFDEKPPVVHMPARLMGVTAPPQSRQWPRIVLTRYDELILVVTPATHGIHIIGYASDQFSCKALERSEVGISVAAIVQAVSRMPLEPVALRRGNETALLAEAAQMGGSKRLLASIPVTDVLVPSALQAQINAHRFGQAAISCRFKVPLAVSPTFTDRSITIVAPLITQSAAALLDVSALADIQNLRFFGGLALPWEGDRTRLFDRSNQLISVEWSDVVAQEQRDVVLVIIGALAAIAASTGLEALRPVVERLTHTQY